MTPIVTPSCGLAPLIRQAVKLCLRPPGTLWTCLPTFLQVASVATLTAPGYAAAAVSSTRLPMRATLLCAQGGVLLDQGFYTVYRSVFEQLARQELDAFEQGSGKTRQPPTFPSFGACCALRSAGGMTICQYSLNSVAIRCMHCLSVAGASDAGAKEVSDFYNFWQNFVTDHTFDWADQFNLAAAPNRPVSICALIAVLAHEL